MNRAFAASMLCAALAGCATTSPKPVTPLTSDPFVDAAAEWKPYAPSIPEVPEVEASRAPPDDDQGRRARIVRTVRRWVGLSTLRKVSRRVNDDCSGLVRLGYGRAGLTEFGASAEMWQWALESGDAHAGPPLPGDLVFFRNTYDRNEDRRRNDGVTHVGIVEKIESDGTVVFIHRGGKGVVRARMNTQRPAVQRDETGRVLNDYLRRPDGTRAPRLAGQLFVGFAPPRAYEPLRAASAPSSPR